MCPSCSLELGQSIRRLPPTSALQCRGPGEPRIGEGTGGRTTRTPVLGWKQAQNHRYSLGVCRDVLRAHEEQPGRARLADLDALTSSPACLRPRGYVPVWTDQMKQLSRAPKQLCKSFGIYPSRPREARRRPALWIRLHHAARPNRGSRFTARSETCPRSPILTRFRNGIASR